MSRFSVTIVPLSKLKTLKNKMKICLVSDQLVGYHKNWSGAEMVCQHVANLLKKKEHEVFFITTRCNESVPDNVLQISSFNFKNHFLNNITRPFTRFYSFFFSFYYLVKKRPDIIHFFHSNFLFISIMLSAKILKIPTVFSVLDYFIICPRNNLRMNNGYICDEKIKKNCYKCVSFLKFFEMLIMSFLYKKLDIIITFTKTSRNRLLRYGFKKENIKVIYTYNIRKNTIRDCVTLKNTVLFVGTFFEYKGLQILIKALPKVISQISNARLFIAGGGFDNDKKRIENLVKELNIEENVIFLGKKKNEEIIDFLFRSEIVVVPEQWHSDFGPLILVEAMTLGKPVIAGNIGAIPEFIKDGEEGFLVEFNNSDKYAEKINFLFKNKDIALKMGIKAKNKIKFFTNTEQDVKIMDLYRELLIIFKK